MCGADDCLEGVKTLGDGSPPHVRGGYTWAIAAFASLRFTPACAGRISHHCWIPRLTWVHPRMCGADQTRAEVVGGGGGGGGGCGGGGVRAPPPWLGGGNTHALHIAHHLVGSPPHVRGGSFKSERKSVSPTFTPPLTPTILLLSYFI